MTATMQRWSMDALGRESLRLVQEPVPQPGPGEVRVRVNAVALNYRDKMVIEGTMPIPLSFPFTPASDMAGVVDSIGEGVTRFKPGARVISTFFPEWIDGKPQADARDLPYKTSGGYFQGMLAEYVIVSENALVASRKAWMTLRPVRFLARGLPHGSRWWSAVIYAPGNRCWYKGRAVWRYSLCR